MLLTYVGSKLDSMDGHPVWAIIAANAVVSFIFKEKHDFFKPVPKQCLALHNFASFFMEVFIFLRFPLPSQYSWDWWSLICIAQIIFLFYPKDQHWE